MGGVETLFCRVINARVWAIFRGSWVRSRVHFFNFFPYCVEIAWFKFFVSTVFYLAYSRVMTEAKCSCVDVERGWGALSAGAVVAGWSV